jgi:hypothetical protein
MCFLFDIMLTSHIVNSSIVVVPRSHLAGSAPPGPKTLALGISTHCQNTSAPSHDCE